MKFSDNIIRGNLDIVFVKRSMKEMEAREEYNSNLWEEVRQISYRPDEGAIYLISTPARDVKIGEDIYNEDESFLAYRSN